MKFTKDVYHRALAAAREAELKVFDERLCDWCGQDALEDKYRRLGVAQHRTDQIRNRAKREKGMTL